MTFHVAILEDEEKEIENLKKCLEKYGQTVGHTFSVAAYTNPRAFLGNYKPVYDMIFMDIRMPEMDGMTAARKLREMDGEVTLVFVTSMVNYAVQGYSVEATDFVVKPVMYASFAMRMKRILASVLARRGKSVAIHTENGARVISSSQIYYVEVSGHDLTYHTQQGDFTVRGKLGDVEQTLAGDAFFRVSASHLVNLRYLTSMNEETVLIEGNPIRVSRSKKRALTSAVAAYLGKGI